ncbi:hypothetical protein evm_002587 [Chilo suppressalis]|nr:hypothetical protein evm_002587 [Chilo suppressalis]
MTFLRYQKLRSLFTQEQSRDNQFSKTLQIRKPMRIGLSTDWVHSGLGPVRIGPSADLAQFLLKCQSACWFMIYVNLEEGIYLSSWDIKRPMMKQAKYKGH